MNHYGRQLQRGFTLMEVMVSVSIFAIVVTVGIAALLTINANYRKSQTDRQAIDNLTYVMESMSRRIRTAATWDVSSYGNNPLSTLLIKDQDGIAVTYSLSNGVITMDTDDNQGGVASYALTPEGTQVSDLTFQPMKGAGGNGQPYLQINVKGKVVNGKQSSDFQFQTSVSKRTFD